jgi:NitT/TauT family transport system ATP-binding protein
MSETPEMASGLTSQSDTASIHVRNLSKEFDTGNGSEEVFTDLSFDIEPNTFVTIIGRSGSGKSTLLNIIGDLLEPTGGEVWFEKSGEKADASLGYVFQSPRLLPWDTCIENIELVHEDNEDFSVHLAREYLDLVGLGDMYDKYPTRLSGGQQQRVGIARALSIDPDVLLMDEPFSNLDEITAESLRDEITRIFRELQKTVLFVTHDIAEAVELSDRILMLGGGEIYTDLEVPLDRPRDINSEEFLSFQQKAISEFKAITEGD